MTSISSRDWVTAQLNDCVYYGYFDRPIDNYMSFVDVIVGKSIVNICALNNNIFKLDKEIIALRLNSTQDYYTDHMLVEYTRLEG